MILILRMTGSMGVRMGAIASSVHGRIIAGVQSRLSFSRELVGNVCRWRESKMGGGMSDHTTLRFSRNRGSGTGFRRRLTITVKPLSADDE